MNNTYADLVRSTHSPSDGGLADQVHAYDRRGRRTVRRGIYRYTITLVRTIGPDAPVVTKHRVAEYWLKNGFTIYRYKSGPGFTVVINRRMLWA